MYKISNQNIGLYSTILIALIAIIPFVIMPLIVGAYVNDFSLTSVQGGRIAVSELVGSACATIILPSFISRLSKQRWFIFGLLLFASANVMVSLADGYISLLIIRCFAGAASGVIIGVAVAIFSDTAKPSQWFALFLLCQLAFGALAFLLLPSLVLIPHGVDGFFLILSIVALISILLAKNAPGFFKGDKSPIKDKSKLNLMSLLVLLAMLLYFSGTGAIWPFIERMGNDRGLPPSDVGAALSIAQLAGMLGAISAFLVATRISTNKAIALGSVLTILSMYYLSGNGGMQSYSIATAVFYFGWIFLVPALMTGIASLDNTGRLPVLGVAMQTSGLALGPYFASFFIVGANHAVAADIGIYSHIYGFILWIIAHYWIKKRK